MTLGIPQIIIVALMVLNIGVSLARYGQAKRDTYDLADVLFAPAIMLGILYWGGFFSPQCQ